MWYFKDDICWCGNSKDCNYTECFRHLDNKKTKDIFTMSYLKDTELCPLTQKEKGKEN